MLNRLNLAQPASDLARLPASMQACAAMTSSITLTLRETPLMPGLYLVATPLGNLSDITLRALETLLSCELILCEDSRVSAKLLRHYGIAKALKRYDDYSDAGKRADILEQLSSKAIALISDAGTPLINDPGFKLARDAIAAGHRVDALPGPSAPILALMLAGLPTDRFSFSGYLPSKAQARQAACAQMAKTRHTQIVFESVHRISASLVDLAAAMGERPAAICREMTKKFQEVDRGTLADLAQRWVDRPAKGEFVVVIGPALEEGPVDIDAAIAAAIADGLSVKEAAAAVAKETGAPKRSVYQRALELKDDR